MPKVREAIEMVERDGWRLDRQRGSHRVYRHHIKRGTVVIPGHPRDDVAPGTWQSILRQAGLK
jgi:predicted RNA binding protein YcfA (HicA-like mRNA interferase family)